MHQLNAKAYTYEMLIHQSTARERERESDELAFSLLNKMYSNNAAAILMLQMQRYEEK